MAFSRVNPLGWALFEELTSAQMNLLDTYVSRAIDGTFGGTYNPSTPININGTINVTNINVGSLTGDAVFTSLVVNGTSTFNGPATFNSTSAFNGAMTINSLVNMNSGQFNFNSSAQFSMNAGNFIVGAGAGMFAYGNVTFSGDDVTFTGADVVVSGGNWDFNMTPDFNFGFVVTSGMATFNGGLTVTGGAVSITSSGAVMTIDSGIYAMEFDGLYADFTACGGFRLPAGSSKHGGPYIEYGDGAQYVGKHIPIQSYVIRLGSWDDYLEYMRHTLYDSASCWFAIPIPRRCTGINEVRLYFNCTDNPASSGMKLTAYSKVAQATRVQIGQATQPVGSHVGDNQLSISGPLTFNGSTQQLLLEVEAPIGNSGASTSELHGFYLDLTIAGMGSW